VVDHLCKVADHCLVARRALGLLQRRLVVRIAGQLSLHDLGAPSQLHYRASAGMVSQWLIPDHKKTRSCHSQRERSLSSEAGSDALQLLFDADRHTT
jgi:hypothetical protein